MAAGREERPLVAFIARGVLSVSEQHVSVFQSPLEVVEKQVLPLPTSAPLNPFSLCA